MPPAGPVRGGARGEGKRAVADERTPPRRRSDADALFTRDEALSGSPIRRARTLLFLIESRTAYLVAQSQRQMDPLLPEVVARERDLAYLQAFALGREPPLRPTIQDVERFAPQWAPLVPDNPRQRAALAQLLGEKYRFAAADVPGLRAALALDGPAVREAYERLYERPLGGIYRAAPTPVARLRWAGVRLTRWIEGLSPFWTAYALNFTTTVGAGVLALPIGLALVGPIPAVVLLVALGLLTQVTLVCIAEAAARSGAVRLGGAYFGRMVGDYLGGTAALITSLMIGVRSVVVLIAYYFGVATTLGESTPVPEVVWPVLMLAAALYLLSRGSLGATVTSALLVGAINIALIATMALFGFLHLDADNLTYINAPFVDGRPLDKRVVQLIFGVILSAYFGHLSVNSCAQVVLRRDGSARSLVWGALAAQVSAMAVYVVWVRAVNGAVSPEALARESGTAVTPLAAVAGPAIEVLGGIFVVLGMGMASVHASFALFNLVQERLPARRRPVLVLPRGRGRLHLYPPGNPDGGAGVAIAYLGARAGRPRFQITVNAAGASHTEEATIAGHWEIAALGDRLPPSLARGTTLALDVLDADDQAARVRVTTSLTVEYEGEWAAAGLGVFELLELPEEERQLVTWVTRRGGATAAEAAAHAGRPEPEARATLDALVEQGALTATADGAERRYRARLSARRGRQLPQHLLDALGDGESDRPRPPAASRRPSPLRALAGRVSDALQSERGRFVLAASPLPAVLLITEYLLITDQASYSAALAWNGVVAASLLGGLLPVLLLVSSRRKGDFVPALVFRPLGSPVVIGAIYLIFLANIFLHGLWLWTEPLMRVSAVAVGVVILAATATMIRRGAFARRLVVMLNAGGAKTDQAAFALVAGGGPYAADLDAGYPAGAQHYHADAGELARFSTLRTLGMALPADGSRELKVWARRTGDLGDAEALPALVTLSGEGADRSIDLRASSGEVLLPLGGDERRVEITLERASSAAGRGGPAPRGASDAALPTKERGSSSERAPRSRAGGAADPRALPWTADDPAERP